MELFAFFFFLEKNELQGVEALTAQRHVQAEQNNHVQQKQNALQTTKPVTCSIKTKGRGKGDPLNGHTAQSKATNNSTTTAPGSTHILYYIICPAHKKALLFTLPLLRWSRAASAYWGRRRCTRDQVFSAEEPSAFLASLCRPSCKTIASRLLKSFCLRQERSGASSSRDFCPPFEETFGLQPTARRGQEELGRAKCSRGATSNYLHDHGDKSPLQAPPSTGGRRAGGQKLSLISRFLWDVAGS